MAIKIALAGNPNCGKTTMFNALTGANQYVGNWPGVTVEKKRRKDKKIKIRGRNYCNRPSRDLFTVPIYTGRGGKPRLSFKGKSGCDY